MTCIVRMVGTQTVLTNPKDEEDAKVCCYCPPFLPPRPAENTPVFFSFLPVAAQVFNFDHSFWSHDPADAHFVDQLTVFRDLGTDVLNNVFEGYNACIFAYGQTGDSKKKEKEKNKNKKTETNKPTPK